MPGLVMALAAGAAAAPAAAQVPTQISLATAPATAISASPSISSTASAPVASLAAADSALSSEPAYYGPRLIRSQVRIPAAQGDYSIATTILRPEGAGPYGVVVLNHGVPGSEEERKSTSAAADFALVAPVFARRGYVVVMPLRRGFGATGGEFAEDAGSCVHPDYLKGENAAADDVMIAYNYARSLPYVDPQRMILAGQSAGGVVSLFAAGARHPEGLVAVLGFASGRGGNPDLSPGVPCAVEPVAEVFERLGKTVTVPVLFHYAENDRYFNADISELWFNRFVAGGANAKYVLQAPFGRDGHHIFGDLIGLEYWLPAVEQFLAGSHVPFQRLDQADPAAQPLLGAKLPYISSQSCSGLYRVFLESGGPRAYAVSGDGHCGFAGGVKDAQAEALRQCGTKATTPCALYAVDAAIVWKNEEAPAALNAGLDSAASQGK